MALKVLLADDSVPAQNMGKKILADAGYEVLAVSNGLEALKKIADSVPDIAILDIFMPGYTGLEVCSRLRGNAVTAELPVILTVGKLEPYRPEDGEKVHSNAVIVKPFASNELVSAVRSLVGLPFAIRPETPEVKAPAPPAPASPPAPEDDFEEEAPMLAGIGFDPDLKRTAFSASAVEEAPAARAKMMRAFEATAAMDLPAVPSALSDFEIEPATATAGNSNATTAALVEWWQPTPDPVEQVDTTNLELAGEAEPPVVAAMSGKGALSEIEIQDEQTAMKAPATLPNAHLPAALVGNSAQSATSALEASVPDRESRMQAFEALFNSEEAIPVEANPAALPDLLAQEELEASQDEAESVSPLALDDGPDQSLPIPAAASATTENLEKSAASTELQLDAESISDWLTTGKVPQQAEPQVGDTPPQANIGLNGPQEAEISSAVEDGPAQPVPTCDSFSAELPEEAELPNLDKPTERLPESPQTTTVEATSPMVCYLPKEAAGETARESSFYASLEPEATGFAYPGTVTQQSVEEQISDMQIEDMQIEARPLEAQELRASMPREAVAVSAEEIAPGVMDQMTSELVQGEAESVRAGQDDVEECQSISATASHGGDAKRIHQAVESVFDRFRPLLIAAIARELTRRD